MLTVHSITRALKGRRQSGCSQVKSSNCSCRGPDSDSQSQGGLLTAVCNPASSSWVNLPRVRHTLTTAMMETERKLSTTLNGREELHFQNKMWQWKMQAPGKGGTGQTKSVTQVMKLARTCERGERDLRKGAKRRWKEYMWHEDIGGTVLRKERNEEIKGAWGRETK